MPVAALVQAFALSGFSWFPQILQVFDRFLRPVA
jgi:hypothetical protein